jgi:serine/threonine-protein kinase PknG
MANPEVPDRKRHCPGCDAKVNRPKGFCPQCGHEYNFVPSLKAGDILNKKFEIKGPIAFGGLGWIYLAYDTILSRWVVLKGLLNTKDEAAAAAAVAERQFLAAVKHPKIVGIYDFIQNGNEGYIVMEYVGGRMIESMLKERGVLPVEEAISYILGILPAFSYLHANKFVYCDFKPANFMLENDDVKLIDMGGVRRIADPSGDIYGTKGYMAPEASDDPVEVSDLYTIGRTLAVLIMDFKYQTTFEHSLPTPAEQPVLAQNEALYRFLLRATHQDPDQRFQTADEMSDQLYGVLREIVALKSSPRPAESIVFTSDNLLDASDEHGASAVDIRFLPTLKIDIGDTAANDLLRSAAVIDPKKRVNTLQHIASKFGEKSVEARLRLADALISNGEYSDAGKILDAIATEDAFDWRVPWYRGKSFLASGDGKAARNEFDKVYFEMPGEIAPKLAIGYASEVAGDQEDAIRYYERVAKVDPNQTTSCFGLARCLKTKGDVSDAAIALSMIPANHSLYNLARIELARVLLHDSVGMNDQILEEAAQTIETISAEGGVVHQLAAKLLSSALHLILGGATKEDHTKQLLGHKFQVAELRLGAESEYRKASRYAISPTEKIYWVDLANTVRPRSII